MVGFKGAHFAKDVILTCVRWYVAYPLIYYQIEELMQEREVAVDHATVHIPSDLVVRSFRGSL